MATHIHVGLVLGQQEYNREILRGLVAYARPSKPWILHFTHWVASTPPAGIERFDAYFGNIGTRGVYEVLRALRKPMVNIQNLAPTNDIPRISIDDYNLGRNVAKHFVERGFKNFAFSGYNRHAYSTLREQGFAEELRDRNFTWSSHVAYDNARGMPEVSDDRFDSLHEWIQTLARPVAILGANDARAWEILEVCRSSNIAVPEDVAVIGVDNDPAICMTAYPTLSSVAVPGERVGYEAARLLDELLQGRTVPLAPMLIPDKGIVTRESSDIIAIGDPEVALALRFIRENATTRIGVNHVVKAAAVARRSLERRFRSVLGRSPLEEIRRVRLERVRELLANTDLSMPSIAARTGFDSAVRLTTVFREEMNMTPTQFRRQFRMHEQKDILDADDALQATVQ